MRLPPYPPRDFECVYRHSCPYLDWLSTTWVLEEYRRADKEYQEQLRIIEAFDPALKAREDRVRVLERENAELKAKLRALHQRQFKANKKKNEPDNGEPSSPEEKKKRGAPVGHPGWSRPQPDHIDRTVEVPAPTVCPHCQSDHLTLMEETRNISRKISSSGPKPLVTCYRHGQAFCPRCNRRWFRRARANYSTPPSGRWPSRWPSIYAIGWGSPTEKQPSCSGRCSG